MKNWNCLLTVNYRQKARESSHHINYKLIMLVPVISIAAVLSGQSDSSQELNTYMTTFTQLNRFSGTVLVAKANKILLNKGYGMANHEFDAPWGDVMMLNNIFRARMIAVITFGLMIASF